MFIFERERESECARKWGRGCGESYSQNLKQAPGFEPNDMGLKLTICEIMT